MIRSVKEVHIGMTPHGKDQLTFWTYMICRVDSGRAPKYNLIRIDNTCDKMERLGCELSLKRCRELIREREST